MKALKNTLALLITLFAATSCEVNDVYEEEWYVEEFKIFNSDWQLVGTPDEIGSYYEYVFYQVPLEVSYHKGVVTAYLFFNYGTKDEVQVPLPYTEYMVDIDPNTNQEIHYSIQYSYDVKADGSIAFKAYVSDYYTKLFNPGTQHFRVAIIW